MIQGSTHFMIGYVAGFLLFIWLRMVRPKNYRIAVYAPLVPFGMGLFFSMPYLFELGGAGELQNYIGIAVNLFGAYGWLHQNTFAVDYLASLNVVAVVCGILYLLIVRHYIKLIRRLRTKNAC